MSNECRILVVDDDEDILDTLKTLLVTANFAQIRAASTVFAAIEIAREFKPHIALLDVVMPGSRNYSLLKALRDECGAGLKIFALTGRADLNLKDVGFDAHLVKPIEPEALIAFLKQHAGNFEMLMHALNLALDNRGRIHGDRDRRTHTSSGYPDDHDRRESD